jgi:hypothetical protein
METITHFGGNIGFANSNHGAMTRAHLGGLGQTIQAGIGKFNILTSVGDNDSLQIAIGKGNLITKVGSGQ